MTMFKKVSSGSHWAVFGCSSEKGPLFRRNTEVYRRPSEQSEYHNTLGDLKSISYVFEIVLFWTKVEVFGLFWKKMPKNSLLHFMFI